MANPVWPASLPQFVNSDGHQEQWGNNLVRTQMDAGEAKVRRRFTKDVRPVDIVVDLDLAQAATFEAFFAGTLKAGSLPFDWVLPRTQAAATFRFVPPVSLSPRPGAKLWRLTAKLEKVA